MSSPSEPPVAVTDDPTSRDAFDRGEGPDDLIEVWNLHDGVRAVVGAQGVFNVVGRLNDPTAELHYSLNGRPEQPVHVLQRSEGNGRLQRRGDFNIDTIDVSDLAEDNELRLRSRLSIGERAIRVVRFKTRPIPTAIDGQAFGGGTHVEEHAQVVDGHWRIGQQDGVPCLQVREADAGYDRIALLASPKHRDFEVLATVQVDRWRSRDRNVGIVFDWHGHPSGAGSSLPEEWTSGLAYYCSKGRGLRLRFGRSVRKIAPDLRTGDLVVGDEWVSRWRGAVTQTLTAFGVRRWFVPQIPAGAPHHLRLRVRDGHYTVTVWRGPQEPQPQIDVESPHLLPPGAVGVIAHNCAVRVFDFRVGPL